jgi:hypothetical protein
MQEPSSASGEAGAFTKATFELRAAGEPTRSPARKVLANSQRDGQTLGRLPRYDGWGIITLPRVQAMGVRVAETVGISERRVRDVLKERAMPPPGQRETMERLVMPGQDDPLLS